jgi:ribosomal protein L16 Arg81 hydroxylase
MTLLADQGEAVATARPFLDLSRIIHPVDMATFRKDYWETKPLVIHRDDPDYYGDLLTLDDIDKALSLSGVMLDNIRLVKEGRETSMSSLMSGGKANSLEQLLAHYRSGSTVVVNSLDSRWEPLQRLSRVLSAELNARIQMNVYVTPAGNQGFKPHYDMHDVFVVQVHGSKKWCLASQPYPLPLDGQPYDRSQPDPEPEQEFELRPGDLIYLPRGTVHWARTNENVSVHITAGVHSVLWSDLIAAALRNLSHQDVRFRKGLPIGFANDDSLRHDVLAAADALMETVRAELTPETLADDAATRAHSITWPTLRHHLTDLEQLDHIGPDTRVRRRPEQRSRLTADDEAVTLAFHDKSLILPARVTSDVQYAAHSNGTGFTARDLPGDLDEPGRVLLVKTLLREGFLTLA